MKYCNRINSGASGALQWAGEHRDYDFTGGEFRSSDVTIGDRRFEAVEIIKGGKTVSNSCGHIISNRTSVTHNDIDTIRYKRSCKKEEPDFITIQLRLQIYQMAVQWGDNFFYLVFVINGDLFRRFSLLYQIWGDLPPKPETWTFRRFAYLRVPASWVLTGPRLHQVTPVSARLCPRRRATVCCCHGYASLPFVSTSRLQYGVTQK